VDGRVEARALQTGISDHDLTAITTGLAAGDVVVTRAGAFLHEGEHVRTVFASGEQSK